MLSLLKRTSRLQIRASSECPGRRDYAFSAWFLLSALIDVLIRSYRTFAGFNKALVWTFLRWGGCDSDLYRQFLFTSHWPGRLHRDSRSMLHAVNQHSLFQFWWTFLESEFELKLCAFLYIAHDLNGCSQNCICLLQAWMMMVMARNPDSFSKISHLQFRWWYFNSALMSFTQTVH